LLWGFFISMDIDMNFARNFDPDAPEGFATHLKEGYVIGLLPGIVIDVNDPEKLNRVRVEIDLIEPNTPWPNANDGWVSFIEPSVIPRGTGGHVSYKLVGARVMLAPIMGSPTNLVALGFLHNRADRPSELTQSIDQTHGMVTPGNVYSVKNDRNASRIDIYPHGVVQNITDKGDITHQTKDNARMSLTHDGDCKLENPKCFTSLANSGLVQQGNDSGAISVLHPEGQVDLQSPFGSGLSLQESQLIEKGPLSGISKDALKLSKLLPGKLYPILEKISYLKDFLSDSNRPDLIVKELMSFVDEFTDLDDILDESLSILDGISSKSPIKIAQSFASEIRENKNLGIADAIKQIKEQIPVIESGNFCSTLFSLLPDALSANITSQNTDYIERIFEIDPSQALKAALNIAIPGGVERINNLLNFDLLDKYDDIDSSLRKGQELNDLIAEVESEPPAINATEEELEAYSYYLNGLKSQKTDLFSEISSMLPEGIDLTSEAIDDILELKDSNDIAPAQLLIGYASQSFTKKLGDKITNFKDTKQKLNPIINLLDPSTTRNQVYSKGMNPEILDGYVKEGSAIGEDWSDLADLDFNELINKTLSPILSEVEDAINNTVEDFSQLIRKIPDTKAISNFVLNETKGIISAKGMDHGGSLEVSPDGGEMMAPDDLTKLAIASGTGDFGSVLGSFFFKDKGIEGGVEVLDFIQAKLKKFTVELGMKKGFRVKISPAGISIGLNGFPEFPNLSRLAKEVIGSKLEIKEAEAACNALKTAFAADSPGMNMVPGKLNMGSKAAPIKMRSSKIGVAGTDFVPFVTLTEESIVYLIEHLFNTAEFVLATHFDYNDYSTDEISNTWEDRVRYAYQNASSEEVEAVLEYLASIQGKASQLGTLMKNIINKQINPIKYLREMFEFTEDEEEQSTE